MHILIITGLMIVGLRRFVFQSLPHYEYPQVTNPADEQVTINPKGKRERIFVDLEAIYHSPKVLGSELCLEELRAKHRGWLTKVWEPEVSLKREIEEVIETITRQIPEKLAIAPEQVALDENGMQKEPGRGGRGRRMKIKEVNETQISK